MVRVDIRYHYLQGVDPLGVELLNNQLGILQFKQIINSANSNVENVRPGWEVGERGHHQEGNKHSIKLWVAIGLDARVGNHFITLTSMAPEQKEG